MQISIITCSYNKDLLSLLDVMFNVFSIGFAEDWVSLVFSVYYLDIAHVPNIYHENELSFKCS